MNLKVPWTKTLLEDFISEGLLTEDEEKLIRTRIAGWSIVKQSMELNCSTATISRMIKKLRQKYDGLHKAFPNRFPERQKSNCENLLDNEDPSKEYICVELMSNLETSCGKDAYSMSAEELIECQKLCPYNKFYK